MECSLPSRTSNAFVLSQRSRSVEYGIMRVNRLTSSPGLHRTCGMRTKLKGFTNRLFTMANTAGVLIAIRIIAGNLDHFGGGPGRTIPTHCRIQYQISL